MTLAAFGGWLYSHPDGCCGSAALAEREGGKNKRTMLSMTVVIHSVEKLYVRLWVKFGPKMTSDSEPHIVLVCVINGYMCV